MNNPRLRGNRPQRRGPFQLGQIPDSVLTEIGKQIVHRLAIGHRDLSGDDFGTIFANAIHGLHRASPLGLADVEYSGCAWSVKTVKATSPFTQRQVRLISGRNSPDYSMGITDPHLDPAATGRAVLSIWNARVNEAMREFEDLRVAVLIRNMQTRDFVLFEEEAQRFVPDEFEWTFNRRHNLEGRDRTTGQHRFTWQPHGSQFTVIRRVPPSARQFSIPQDIPTVNPSAIFAAIQFQPDWIQVHDD